MLSILPISEESYEISESKLIAVSNATRFYTVQVSGTTYSISSEFDSSHFVTSEFDCMPLLCVDNRVFIFSDAGELLLSLKIFEIIKSHIITPNFVLIYSDRIILKIDRSSLILYEYQMFSDLIENVSMAGNEILVSCIDGEKYTM
jgi:hypothetical protein